MMCTTCGAWTEVKATREASHGMTRRRRVCANGHAFYSIEIPEITYTRARPAIMRSVATIMARRGRWDRDVKIMRDPRHRDVVAKAHALSGKEVTRIRARMRKELST